MRQNRFVMLHWHYIFYKRKEILLWHTLLVMVASAAVHVLLSALFQLFLREIHSTLSTLTLASTAVLAQLSALFQPSHRVDNNQMKTEELPEFQEALFLFVYSAQGHALFANLVNSGSHTSSTVPIGPLLCLAMIISEMPFFSVSLL